MKLIGLAVIAHVQEENLSNTQRKALEKLCVAMSHLLFPVCWAITRFL